MKDKKLEELQTAYYAAESALVAYALENNLDLYIEGKGSLLLEDDNGWSGKTRGDWYTSTDSCT